MTIPPLPINTTIDQESQPLIGSSPKVQTPKLPEQPDLLKVGEKEKVQQPPSARNIAIKDLLTDIFDLAVHDNIQEEVKEFEEKENQRIQKIK